ncbi:MAG: thermosome subunit alpha [Candidatus Woesearchaeota archaeon]|jgi:thermosome|nr:thermosome subunit alpha [Candidatus Woesearchaeota archaeon]
MTRKTSDILDENTNRTKGIDALNSNIEAAKALANIVKTTLGPMGMDKMLIDSMGDTVITNDGVKILKEMEIEHPGAKLLVEVAKTQENEVGDGTTTAVILTGEFLSQAQNLIEQKIHPTTIIRAYKKASIKAIEVLTIASIKVNTNNPKVLKDISETAMTGKVAEGSKECLTKLIYEATKLVEENNSIPKKTIKIQKVVGGDTKDSSIVKGIVLDKDLANPNMPKQITDAKILLIDFPLEVRELDSDANLQINTPKDYDEFLNHEQDYLKQLAFRIKQIGANVVICQKGIDDNVSYYLAKEGIIATRRTRKSDLEKLSIALKKPIVNTIDDIDSSNLGDAQNVELKEILDDNYLFIEGVKNTKAITLILKASTSHLLDEIERAVDDALGDINAILKSKRLVAGGGAIELELHKELNNYAKTFQGKEQIIIESYAKAFLSIPKILCENSGFDEIETITKLIALHEKGKKQSGINGYEGVVEDTIKHKIVEPINIKEQAIKSATEISSMILRIDDIIAAKTLKSNSNNNPEF